MALPIHHLPDSDALPSLYSNETLSCSADLGFPSPAADDLSLETSSPHLTSHIGGRVAKMTLSSGSKCNISVDQIDTLQRDTLGLCYSAVQQ